MAGDWHDRILMVIPSINGAALLGRMLPTLRFKPSNVIVLDQASTDDTARICQEAGVQLLQLGRPHTYTEACNIGARIARERAVPFLCVSNNDITFRTGVLAELLGEMDRDPRLGIVAPSQIILDPAHGVDVLTRRVSWNLGTVEFLHDFDASPAPPRLEADFCELTCVLIRMAAVEQVSFLDNTYGFYHEDADFCFRLRKAGYGAAYLPRSQIVHFTSSTFGGRRQEQLDYQSRNRAYFAKKHLVYGVRQPEGIGSSASEAATAARRLYPYLSRFGLIDDSRRGLAIGRVGAATADYLLTPQRVPVIPQRWLALRGRYPAVLATSDAVVDGLRSAGFTSFRAPLGVDPDIFNPWGPVARRYDGTTYLAMADPYDRRPLATLLHAWRRFAASGRQARLIVVGTRLTRLIGRAADTAYRSGQVEISCFAAERLEVRETEAPLADQQLAELYRSADFTVVAAAEGSSLTLLESLACGTPVVFDPGAASVVSLYRDATGGRSAGPAQTDRPDADGLLAALEESARWDATERAARAEAGRYGVLGHSTLRHTAMALRHALEMTQEPAFRTASAPPPAPAPSAPAVAPPPATPLRPSLSGVAARRLTVAGHLAARFGTVWQSIGLPATVSLTATRARQAVARRLRPGPALSGQAVPEPAAPPPPRQPSPLLIGYIDAQLGIGQSLRGLAFAMAEAGTPFGIYPVGLGVEGRRSVPVMTERYDEVTPHDINIIEVSPDELPRVFGHISADHFTNSYNILRTYWELAKGPVSWRQGHGMDRIDEVWAPNAFCAAAFRDFFDGPIVIVPPCLDIAETTPGKTPGGRQRFGLDPDVFYFMFSFDYHSFAARKNPFAVVRAFLTAFPDFDAPVGLVVKAASVGGHSNAMERDVRAAADADGRIVVVDRSLSREDMLSLMASVDCYVSLHRSEGFGLGMAEAMALEKPVIATAYSGNAEFVTPDTAYPIPFTLKPVRPHEYVHTEGQIWAEPDEDACIAAMRNVAADPGKAASRARAGRVFVENRYGMANVGRIVAGRLDEIRMARLPEPPPASQPGGSERP